MEINIHETKNATPLVNGSAVPRGTACNVNAPVEIAGFDFSGTARYRTVSERYFNEKTNWNKIHAWQSITMFVLCIAQVIDQR
jgi:hypothetical protein